MVMVALHSVLTPWLLAWQLTGHPDGAALAEAGRMFEVPAPLMWATALAETRRSPRNTEVSRAGAHGRMQILPRAWGWQCGAVLGTARYVRNIHCGALVLKYYLDKCGGDARCASYRYVGGDSTYAREVGANSLLYELKASQMVWPKRGEAVP